MKTSTPRVLAALTSLCLAGVTQNIQALNPPPDGCYPGLTTAEGCSALFSLTTGQGNTAIGHDALFNDTSGSWNTGVGAVALGFNNGDFNTAVGVAGLLLNNTGGNNTAVGTGAMVNNDSGSFNTANGAFALFSNTEGSYNTAAGDQALFSNSTGAVNTAIGAGALTNNTTGHHNTAVGGDFVLFGNTTGTHNTSVGVDSLASNTTGIDNTANGAFALSSNTTGVQNTAIGYAALVSNTTAGADTNGANTAVGAFALQNNTTSGANTAIGYATLGNVTTNGGNTAIGDLAGFNVTGSQNICIGSGVGGFAGDNNTIRIGSNLPDTEGASACYIGGIYNQLSGGSPVLVNVSGKLGTSASSKRFKQDINPMDRTSEALFALKPVTFRYRKEIDPEGLHQFGLVAEDVEKVNPDLVVCDRDGKAYTVRYDAVNAMLLNEFLKEHHAFIAEQRKVQKLEAALVAVNQRLKEQEARIERVSAAIITNKSATQLARVRY